MHHLILVKSFQDINQLLFSNADKFIPDYKVLTEASTGRIYRVLVEATVSVDKIRELFSQNNILMQSETPLTVLLLIAEKNLDDTVYRCWWTDPFVETVSEAGIADALGGQGLIVLDHGRLWPAAPGTSFSEMERPPGPDITDAQAALFGVWFQADVVVVGTATAERASNTLGDTLRSFKGGLSVRAIRTDTGDILAETTRDVLTADTDDPTGSRRALTEAGTLTGALLAEQIQATWQQAEEKGPIATTLVVEGNYQFVHLVAFRRILSGMPGVSDLQTKGMTPDETILGFDYKGTTQNLAEALLLKSFDGFGITITEAAQDTIRLSLTANQ